MRNFLYVASPVRVEFGAGALERLPREIGLLGAHRALVLSTPGHADDANRVAQRLGERAAGVFARAAMHVPIETAAEARAEAARLGADCTVAFGGGSTIGLAKAIALDSGLPILAIPTTYAGSEMTSIYGLTEAGMKRTGKDPRVLPRAVIYDPRLTLALPVALSVTSGFNAIAHAVEGLYAENGNPVMDLLAEEGLRAMASALPAIHREPRDIEARSQALHGAWLCGMVLGGVGMALHHKLCHTLGGSFGLRHAEVHTVVLPHAIAYNAPAISSALARMRRALGRDDPAAALYDLACEHGAPCSLRSLGLAESDLDRAADLATRDPYWNPRPVERDGILALLQNAWAGRRPSIAPVSAAS
ncbi:MAG: maleylacetate reductase [Steroidobacteraceae bacterium]